MNKIYLLPLFAMLFLTNVATAQLESGTIAPNFTATDINGNTYELYEVLAEGKTVVLDLFATWCGPCWGYHQDHVLEDLYKAHGPEGDNTMMVFGIEADSRTGMADLMGNTSESLGNWLNGITYPMIDDAGIGELYNVGYFPTIYHICDGRIVTETAQQPLDAFADFNSACPTVGDVNILEYTGYEGTICGEEVFSPTIKIQNLIGEEVTTLDLQLVINNELVEELTWEADETLSNYGFATIAFDEVMVEDDTEMTIGIVNINGNNNPAAGQTGTITVNLERAAIETEVIYLELQTDEFGHENYWELTNEAGELITSGGNSRVGKGGNEIATPNDQGAYASSTLIVETIEVGDGCYFFTMYDDYADGMCCVYGEGYYTISDDSGNILLRGSEFEAAQSDKFFNNNPATVDIQEIRSLNSLNIAPNPATTSIQVEIGLAESTDLNVAIFNNLGQNIKTIAAQRYASGLNQMQVDVSDLASGIYFVNLQSKDGTKTKRFVVQR